MKQENFHYRKSTGKVNRRPAGKKKNVSPDVSGSESDDDDMTFSPRQKTVKRHAPDSEGAEDAGSVGTMVVFQKVADIKQGLGRLVEDGKGKPNVRNEICRNSLKIFQSRKCTFFPQQSFIS